MSATPIAIADALVVYLNDSARGYSTTFVADRHYVPTYELKELSAIKVPVVPRSIQIGAHTREKRQRDYIIDIGVMHRAGRTLILLDPLVLLVEEIGLSLEYKLIGDARIVDVQIPTLYMPAHLEEWGQFTSVISATCRVWS